MDAGKAAEEADVDAGLVVLDRNPVPPMALAMRSEDGAGKGIIVLTPAMVWRLLPVLMDVEGEKVGNGNEAEGGMVWNEW